MSLSTLDLAVIAVYLVAVAVIGMCAGRVRTPEDYFANSRNTGLFLLVCTMASTAVGAGVVVGVVSSSFASGISFGLLMAIMTLVGWGIMAWLAPRIKAFGDERKAYTFSEYLADRFSPSTAFAGSVVIVASFFVLAAIQFVALAQLIEALTSVSYVPALIIVSSLTVAYAAFKGLKGDFYTDVVQAAVILAMFAAMLIIGFRTVDTAQLFDLPAGYLDPGAYGGPVFFWAGILFGLPLVATSADVWQRIYAARDVRTARRAILLTGILKTIVVACAVLLGLMAYHVVPEAPQSSALLSLMESFLPQGLLGLGIAAILAVIMSTVDSAIVVGSAVTTRAVAYVRGEAGSDVQVMRTAKLSALAFGAGGFLVACFVRDIVTLTIVSAQVMLVFTPALAGGLLFGHRYANAALWSIIVGFSLTLAALPFSVNLAFLPGLVGALVTYLVIHLLGRRFVAR